MEQRHTGRGWYLLRANATSHTLTVTIRHRQAERRRRFNANLLPGRRLRTYIWCEQGEVSVDPDSHIVSLDKVSGISVHAKAIYRLCRYSDFSLKNKLQWSLKSLGLKGKRLESLFSLVKINKQLFSRLDCLEQRKSPNTPTISILDSIAPKNQMLSQLKLLTEQDWVVFTFSSVRLHPNTNIYLAAFAQSNPDCSVAYSNHFDSQGVCFTKPNFNIAAVTSYNFISPAVFIKPNSAENYLSHHNKPTPDTLLQWIIDNSIVPKRIDEFLIQSDRVEHVSHQANLTQPISTVEQGRTLAYGERFDKHIASPSVSIIIPTFNGYELLKTCIDGLMSLTTYAAFDITVVDNNSDEATTLSYLSELETRGIKVLRYPFSFNYSAINNFAVTHTKGDYLCFLNNDIEVISKDWLGSLMYWATREHTGAVGARLLYPNGKIQHAGLVVGMGGAAGHLHRFDTNPCAPGYTRSMLNAAVTTEVSAVTAACLVVKRQQFEQVDGFNQTNLAVAYNDVDFCLKLNELGYRNIYCAEAQLYHHESVSRGDDLAADKVQRYMQELKYLQRKWQTKTYIDPLFSQHLHLHLENQPELKTHRQFN